MDKTLTIHDLLAAWVHGRIGRGQVTRITTGDIEREAVDYMEVRFARYHTPSTYRRRWREMVEGGRFAAHGLAITATGRTPGGQKVWTLRRVSRDGEMSLF